ncbi:TfoX/Sxy family protein [Rhodobacteraceae bacterium NNCM2]|nr:TfoX/Sxy family protein [Coraliihabitans acroporae]
MAVSAEFLEHVRDLFADLGPVSTRRMFGGAGVYIGDAMFALIVDETLFMKADPDLAARYAEAGSGPFVYSTKSGPRTINGLMRLPDSALDDAEEALDWARQSMVPAEAAAAEKRAAKPRKAAKKRG